MAGSKGGDAMKRALLINPKDNTATALDDIEAGEMVSLASSSGQIIGEVKAQQAVPFGHKLAVADIGQGDKVLKYGEVIGLATQAINKGDYVHVHNVESALLPPPKEVG
jgi:altronate dehydratase small subunit